MKNSFHELFYFYNESWIENYEVEEFFLLI